MITIKKEGIFKENKKIKKINILSVLRLRCQIEANVTLGHILKTVDNYQILKKFLTRYSWCDSLEELHAEAFQPYQPPEDDVILNHLEIYWHGTISDIKGINCSYGFHAVAANGSTYSISASPLWEVIDLPVNLKEDFLLINKSNGNLTPCKQAYTLLEVLDAIYDDLSFHGGPENKRRFVKEMKSEVEKIKND